MALITKRYTFEAAHQLVGHKGKCAAVHGHSYEVRIAIQGSILDPLNEYQLSDSGMVIDFSDINDAIKLVIEEYCDHHNLNETLTEISRTTAELIACWFYGVAKAAGFNVRNVRVRETDTSEAYAFEEDWIAAGRPGKQAWEKVYYRMMQ